MSESPVGQRVQVRGRIGNLLRFTQIITLWTGVDRVDCHTVIEDFRGSDQLLRLRWPCPVQGALPVSEVGDAVVGRGFGLTHDHSGGSRPEIAVDTAEYPWTLDNPAFGWFGLSSTVRVCAAGQTRAISVVEVVAPGPAGSSVRELLVALARKGVTATCSSAAGPRYGDLAVDSNLPDARIALGGPEENGFTAELLAQADACYAREVERQFCETGTALVWVPADDTLARRWVPGADLRGPRALPVLVVVGGDDAVTALTADLADARIDVEQQVPAGVGPFDPYTVALLNRGIPGFTVDSDGTLHSSLLRSCTGWPSGTWIDPPRRTAPDGSNFQLQHWTDTYDYAVCSGPGDWRDVGLPMRSAEFGSPLRAVVGSGPAAGGLPPWGALLEIEPAGSVALGALKAGGNPLPRGSAEPVDPRADITLRIVETSGSTVDVEIQSGMRAVTSPVRVNLLEEPLAQADAEPLRLHGYEIATVRTRLNMPQVFEGDHAQLGPEAEAAQPLYARYWLHNRGPAPLGGLPAVAHLHPAQLSAAPGAPISLRLTASSDAVDTALHGRVRLIGPPGWAVQPGVLPFVLPPGGYLEAGIELKVPPAATPGLYPVRAELSVTGGDSAPMPVSWRQSVEDVCLISVGGSDDVPVRLLGEPRGVRVRAGGAEQLTVTVGTEACAALAVEAHLISPWGTWEWTGPRAQGAELPARGSATLQFSISPPAWTAPGRWWALVRIAAAGHVVYSPAVDLEVYR